MGTPALQVGLLADLDGSSPVPWLALRAARSELRRRLPGADVRAFSVSPRGGAWDGGEAVEAIPAWGEGCLPPGLDAALVMTAARVEPPCPAVRAEPGDLARLLPEVLDQAVVAKRRAWLELMGWWPEPPVGPELLSPEDWVALGAPIPADPGAGERARAALDEVARLVDARAAGEWQEGAGKGPCHFEELQEAARLERERRLLAMRLVLAEVVDDLGGRKDQAEAALARWRREVSEAWAAQDAELVALRARVGELPPGSGFREELGRALRFLRRRLAR